MNHPDKTVYFEDLGTTDYRQAWELQTRLFDRTRARKTANRTAEHPLPTEDFLLLTQHPPVYTLGRHGDPSHLLVSPETLQREGVGFFRIDRGGDITFHGPGQIVGYPILDLDHFTPDIHRYVFLLEETVIRTLADFAVTAGRVAGRSGAWIEPESPRARKICAVGVRTSRWVTMHGFALNVNTPLEYFRQIVPCGISDRGVTSLAQETGGEIPLSRVKDRLLTHFADVFACRLVSETVANFL